MARNDPHPGQYHPVKYRRGQGGKTPELAGSKTRNMSTAPAAVANIAASSQ
jgi:hypothetical protein